MQLVEVPGADFKASERATEQVCYAVSSTGDMLHRFGIQKKNTPQPTTLLVEQLSIRQGLRSMDAPTCTRSIQALFGCTERYAPRPSRTQSWLANCKVGALCSGTTCQVHTATSAEPRQ
jgi:hypothetical protein